MFDCQFFRKRFRESAFCSDACACIDDGTCAYVFSGEICGAVAADGHVSQLHGNRHQPLFQRVIAFDGVALLSPSCALRERRGSRTAGVDRHRVDDDALFLRCGAALHRLGAGIAILRLAVVRRRARAVGRRGVG
jgi:hypothetical protein